MSDDLLFIDDFDDHDFQERESWKVLIVDDEPEIHAVTKLALTDFVFQDKDIEFISAHSGEDAKDVMRAHNDIAVVLLDVVMETDDAGLRVAEFIRKEVKNYFTRIILRTGQPGQAPEHDVVMNYDINDYKSKTELTSQKLFTTLISALRSYRDIININKSREGLEQLINASTSLFSLSSLESFMQSLVQQLTSLVGGGTAVSYLSANGVTNTDLSEYVLYQGRCGESRISVQPAAGAVDGNVRAACVDALRDKSVVIRDDFLVAYCESEAGSGSLLLLTGLPESLSDVDRTLIELFAKTVQVAFEKVQLTQEAEEKQQEILSKIGKALEVRLTGGQHIQRITLMCELLAKKCNLSSDDIDTFALAVRLHDLGSLVAPVSILARAGKLSAEEMAQVRKQVSEEIAMVNDARHPVIKIAAMLTREQQERWDGKGYPNQKQGEDIHLYSRILAIAAVFDGIRSTQSNESDTRTLQDALAFMQDERGLQFDPKLVDLLVAHGSDFENIVMRFPDSK